MKSGIRKQASVSQRFEMARDGWQGQCDGGDSTEQREIKVGRGVDAASGRRVLDACRGCGRCPIHCVNDDTCGLK